MVKYCIVWFLPLTGNNIPFSGFLSCTCTPPPAPPRCFSPVSLQFNLSWLWSLFSFQCFYQFACCRFTLDYLFLFCAPWFSVFSFPLFLWVSFMFTQHSVFQHLRLLNAPAKWQAHSLWPIIPPSVHFLLLYYTVDTHASHTQFVGKCFCFKNHLKLKIPSQHPAGVCVRKSKQPCCAQDGEQLAASISTCWYLSSCSSNIQNRQTKIFWSHLRMLSEFIVIKFDHNLSWLIVINE